MLGISILSSACFAALFAAKPQDMHTSAPRASWGHNMPESETKLADEVKAFWMATNSLSTFTSWATINLTGQWQDHKRPDNPQTQKTTKQRQKLIKTAKANGGRLGFLAWCDRFARRAFEDEWKVSNAFYYRATGIMKCTWYASARREEWERERERERCVAL